MPYTERQQQRLFRAAAHNPDIAKKHGMTRKQARRMMHEGEKMSPKDHAMMRKHGGGY